MYKSVLIAAALFSEGATTKAAIARARKMLDPGGKITLVHVIDEVPGYVAASIPKEHLTARRRDVEEQMTALADGAADIGVVVREGQPSAGILGTAQEIGADLIMIASHKPGFGDFFIGSTASRIVRHAQVSVLVSR